LEHLIKVIGNNRFYLLSIILFGLIFFASLQTPWSGDFFEHAAVVKELSVHPLNPKNPIILSNAKHAFFSPYSLMLGLTARLFHFKAAEVLYGFTFVNLFLLLFIFRRFIFTYFDSDKEIISFYSLLAILFFWGPYPWVFSGFIHFNVLLYVLPYPSTFAIILGFLLLILTKRLCNRHNIIFNSILAILVTAVIILSHIITALAFLAFIIIYITIVPSRTSSVKSKLIFLGIFSISLSLSLLWPYYSLVGLVLKSNEQIIHFNYDTITLYEDVFKKILPFFIFLPTLLLIDKRHSLFPFALAFLLFSIIYVLGYFTSNWGLGRSISFAALFFQVIIGWKAAMFEKYLVNQRKIYMLSLLAVCVFFISGQLKWFKETSLTEKPSFYRKFEFLEKYTAQYEVVLSDLETSFYIPSQGGKVIGSPHPLYFISDALERRKAIERLFQRDASKKELQATIKKYAVTKILLKKELPISSEIEAFLKHQKKIYSDFEFDLFSLN
jgi:hypothetical protein